MQIYRPFHRICWRILLAMKVHIILFCSAFLASCSVPVTDLELKSEKGIVNLAEQVSGSWEKVCILTPYTTGIIGKDVTGIDSSVIQGTGIGTSDSYNILAFINRDQTYSLYKVSMRNVVFIYTKAQCFTKDSANLMTRR